MWIPSFLSVLVFLFGVLGTVFFYGAKNFDYQEDLFEWKWDGLESILGVSVYAMEGRFFFHFFTIYKMEKHVPDLVKI